VTGLAYVTVRADRWPVGLREAAPPASLPTTLAVFGLLVYLISFIPVVRRITRLADPYFVTNDRGDLQIGGLSEHHVSERRLASSLIVALVVINQLQVAINIRLSFFNRDWFNAIQNKDSTAFWSLLFGVFCFWAAIAVGSSVVEYYTESVLKIRGWGALINADIGAKAAFRFTIRSYPVGCWTGKSPGFSPFRILST